MSIFRNLDWDDWLYGMWVALATGSSGSVLAGLFVNTVIPNVSKGQFWTLLFGFFVLGGVKDFFLYINKNPAPKRIPVTVTDSIKVPGGAEVTHVVQTSVAESAESKPAEKKDPNG